MKLNRQPETSSTRFQCLGHFSLAIMMDFLTDLQALCGKGRRVCGTAIAPSFSQNRTYTVSQNWISCFLKIGFGVFSKPGLAFSQNRFWCFLKTGIRVFSKPRSVFSQNRNLWPHQHQFQNFVNVEAWLFWNSIWSSVRFVGRTVRWAFLRVLRCTFRLVSFRSAYFLRK